MAKSKRVDEIPEQPEDRKLRLFVCTDHDKHQPEAHVSSVVLALDERRAVLFLDAALVKAGLRPRSMWRYRIDENPLDKELAEVLNDGDY